MMPLTYHFKWAIVTIAYYIFRGVTIPGTKEYADDHFSVLL